MVTDIITRTDQSTPIQSSHHISSMSRTSLSLPEHVFTENDHDHMNIEGSNTVSSIDMCNYRKVQDGSDDMYRSEIANLEKSTAQLESSANELRELLSKSISIDNEDKDHGHELEPIPLLLIDANFPSNLGEDCQSWGDESSVPSEAATSIDDESTVDSVIDSLKSYRFPGIEEKVEPTMTFTNLSNNGKHRNNQNDLDGKQESQESDDGRAIDNGIFDTFKIVDSIDLADFDNTSEIEDEIEDFNNSGESYEYDTSYHCNQTLSIVPLDEVENGILSRKKVHFCQKLVSETVEFLPANAEEKKNMFYTGRELYNFRIEYLMEVQGYNAKSPEERSFDKEADNSKSSGSMRTFWSFYAILSGALSCDFANLCCGGNYSKV